jgi:hypothetical protein
VPPGTGNGVAFGFPRESGAKVRDGGAISVVKEDEERVVRIRQPQAKRTMCHLALIGGRRGTHPIQILKVTIRHK